MGVEHYKKEHSVLYLEILGHFKGDPAGVKSAELDIPMMWILDYNPPSPNFWWLLGEVQNCFSLCSLAGSEDKAGIKLFGIRICTP